MMMKPLFRPLMFVVLTVMLSQVVSVRAQADAPGLTLTAEHDIGFDCPVASAVQPKIDVLWVLMDSCGGSRFSLHAYNLTTGAALDRAPIKLDQIDGGAVYMYSFTTPLAFTPGGMLEVFTFSYDTHERTSLKIDPYSGAVTTDAEADERVNQLVRQVSEYGEQAVYSPDHTFAVAPDDVNLHVLDIAREKLLSEINAPLGQVVFSPDSQQVYISVFDEPDNMENYSATTSVYQLPDGALVKTLAVTTGFIFPSPDGRYLAAQVNDSQLGVIEVATGAMSPLVEMWEKPGRALKCENDGRDISDVDFPRSGRLTLSSVEWLPDSSGFVTLNSYGGEGAGGGRLCRFNHSRLRQYIIDGMRSG